MKRYLIVILSCLSIGANAQTIRETKKGQNSYTFNLAFASQLFLNGINVENDGIAPEAIRTKNTGGYTFGAEIERKGKRGLILNFGLEYGSQHHNITMGYNDLSFFDPSIADELNKVLGPFIDTYIITTRYINFRLMTGYVLPFRVWKDCNIEFKTGIYARFYRSEYSDYPSLLVQVQKNNSIYIADISKRGIYVGGKDNRQKGIDVYVGLSKNISYKYFKNISIGIEMTKGIYLKGQEGGGAFGYVDSYYLYGDKTSSGINIPSSVDKYNAKDLSIGLRLSAGLWHK